MELRPDHNPRARRYHRPVRKAIQFLLAAALAGLAAVAAAQESYPNRGLRLIVDTSPGGVTDLFGRLMAEGLSQKTGQPVVVDNKPGASGNLAIDFLVRSPPDGYTIMIASGGGIVVKPFMEKGLSFDVMTDLVPVINVAEVAHILVVPGSVPVNDIGEFIAWAKSRPGKVYYGSAGVGSPPHLSMELFARVAGLKLVHVPYKGVGGAMPDLLAGRVQIMSMALGSARPYLKTGQLRPLVAGASHRLTNLPEVPTAAEAGIPGWSMSAWFGVFAPRGTPLEIVHLLNEKLQAVLDDARVRQRLLDVGGEPLGGSAESFAERYRADYRMWGQFLRETGIKQE
jgi:tripartite-type tricarboxylate transporter receptor subunit TctC